MRPLLLVAGVAVPGVAFADALVPADPARAPGFVQIDRYDATSVAGGDLSYVSLDGASEDVTVLRFQLGGRYVDRRSNVGGYVNLPITYASGNGDSLTAIGNLEVGGILLPKLGEGSTVALHAGLTLPTADDDEDALVNILATTARPQDLFLAIPQGTSLRLGASPMFRSGNVFGRVDVGIDININNGGGGDESDPLVHVNAGIGIDLGGAAVMGELSNVYLTDGDADFSDRLINVFALSARFTAGKAMPYLSLLIPLDDNATSTIDLAFTAGLEARL